jgi:hypothetical protein
VNCTGHQSRFACSPLQRRAQTPDGWHLCACLFAFASMVVRAMCVFECVCVVFSYLMLRGKAVRYCSLLAFTVHYCWPEPCVYGVYTVFLAGKLLYIGLARTVYILRI